MQETWVQSLMEDNPSCLGATKFKGHNYWNYALKPRGCNYWSLRDQDVPQQEKPLQWEARSPQLEYSPHSQQLEESPHNNEDPAQPKIDR